MAELESTKINGDLTIKNYGVLSFNGYVKLNSTPIKDRIVKLRINSSANELYYNDTISEYGPLKTITLKENNISYIYDEDNKKFLWIRDTSSFSEDNALCIPNLSLKSTGEINIKVYQYQNNNKNLYNVSIDNEALQDNTNIKHTTSELHASEKIFFLYTYTKTYGKSYYSITNLNFPFFLYMYTYFYLFNEKVWYKDTIINFENSIYTKYTKHIHTYCTYFKLNSNIKLVQNTNYGNGLMYQVFSDYLGYTYNLNKSDYYKNYMYSYSSYKKTSPDIISYFKEPSINGSCDDSSFQSIEDTFQAYDTFGFPSWFPRPEDVANDSFIYLKKPSNTLFRNYNNNGVVTSSNNDYHGLSRFVYTNDGITIDGESVGNPGSEPMHILLQKNDNAGNRGGNIMVRVYTYDSAAREWISIEKDDTLNIYSSNTYIKYLGDADCDFLNYIKSEDTSNIQYNIIAYISAPNIFKIIIKPYVISREEYSPLVLEYPLDLKYDAVDDNYMNYTHIGFTSDENMPIVYYDVIN